MYLARLLILLMLQLCVQQTLNQPVNSLPRSRYTSLSFRLESASVIYCYVAVFGVLSSFSLPIIATGLRHTFILCYIQEIQISTFVYSRILSSCKREANVGMYQAYMYHEFKSIYVRKKWLVSCRICSILKLKECLQRSVLSASVTCQSNLN